jgi:DNA-binding FadR family transcriptional regulator
MHTSLEAMANAGSLQEWLGPDLAFHRAILVATGNELLISLGHFLEPALSRSFTIVDIEADKRQASVPRHWAVYAAIERGNPDAARAAMVQLLDEALVDLEEMIGAKETSKARRKAK